MRWVIYGAIQERHLTDSLAAALRAAGHDVATVPGIARDYVVGDDDAVSTEAARRISDALPADVVFCIRVDEPRAPFVRSLRDRGITTIAWFLDDPLNYASIYARVVEAYDITLHTGAEDVLRLYEERHGVAGYHFPFYTDDAHYPYVYDPNRADIELGFLGNTAGEREAERYPLLASLPFGVKMFGRLARAAEDWAGILAGFVPENRIPDTLARFKVGFNIAQPFDESIADKYGWPGVARFHEFFFPSRLVAYAAAGIPAVSLQHPAMPRPLGTTVVATSRIELIAGVRALLEDGAARLALSRATRAEFEACLTAASRVRLLEQLLTGSRDHDLSARATLWRDVAEPTVAAPPIVETAPRSVGLDPPELRPVEQLARARVLVIGRDLGPGTAAGGLIAEADAVGIEVVAVDVDAMPGIAADHFRAPPGEGPVEIDDEVLARAVTRADADGVVFLDGCLPSEKAAADLRARGVTSIGLRLHGTSRAEERSDHVLGVASGTGEGIVAAIDAAPPSIPVEDGTVRVCGGHPEAAAAMRWRLGERLVDGPAAIEVFQDGSDPAEVLAGLARGALPLGLGAMGLSVPVAGAAAPGSTAGTLGAALFYSGRPEEARALAEDLRARAVTSHRWAHRWSLILEGVQARTPRERPRPRITAIGHWGRGNLGDDLLLEALLEQLACDPTVVTYEPAEAMRGHGTPAVHINDLDAIEASLRASSVLVIGGGGLLHDITFREGGTIADVFGGSRRMLPRMARIAATARALGVPVALHALGVGPLATDAARAIVRFLCEQATLVSVRDEASREQLRACGFDGDVLLAADTVVLLALAEPQAGEHIAVSIRRWDDAPPGLPEQLALALDRVADETDARIAFVPFQRGPADRSDVGAIEAVRARMRHDALVVGAEEPAAVIAGARAVVAMRLHASILAAAAGVPSVGLSYDPKVSAFYDELGLPARALPLDASADRIVAAASEAVRAGGRELREPVARLRARARDGIRALQALIGEPRPRHDVARTEVEATLAGLRDSLERGGAGP